MMVLLAMSFRKLVSEGADGRKVKDEKPIGRGRLLAVAGEAFTLLDLFH
jgi:hypothetical protein